MPFIREILSAYLADRKPVVAAPARIERAIRALSALGDIMPSDLTRERLAAYVEQRMSAGSGSGTVRRDLVVLRASLRLAWRDGRIDRLPHISLPPRGPARQRVLTRDEITRMTNACAVDADPATSVLWHLLLCTGARISALMELTWARVDWDARAIDLRRVDDPLFSRRKGRAVVPIDRALHAVLRTAHRRASGSYVLPFRSSCAARRRLCRCAKRAAVVGVTPHIMRHTAATWMLRAGVSLIVVSRMLGHKSVVTTEQEYSHLVTDDLAQAAKALGRLAR